MILVFIVCDSSHYNYCAVVSVSINSVPNDKIAECSYLQA
jgi:hypothetical protein